MNIPSSLRVGDTWEWTDSLGDYLASDGWTLHYALANSAGQIILDSSADGDDHAIAEDATDTADYAAGTYTWVAYVTEAGGERHTIDSGVVELLPDLVAQTSGYDARTHAQKMVDALRAIDLTISGKAHATISIGGKSMTYRRQEDVDRALEKWESRLRDEQGVTRMIRSTFGRP